MHATCDPSQQFYWLLTLDNLSHASSLEPAHCSMDSHDDDEDKDGDGDKDKDVVM